MVMSTIRHTELAALIFRDMSADLIFYPMPQIAQALDLIHDYDPHAIEFMERVLTTGPKAARDAAAYKLASVTETFAEAWETGENWLERCRRILGSELINEVMPHWSIACVTNEWCGDVADYRIVMWVDKVLLSIHEDELGLRQHPVNFEDWRGLAALGAVRVEGEPEQLNRFIKYAGPAKDIAAVIDTARERGTLDPVTIDAVINGSDAVSLRNGAL
jgi:hypothetical protein